MYPFLFFHRFPIPSLSNSIAFIFHRIGVLKEIAKKLKMMQRNDPRERSDQFDTLIIDLEEFFTKKVEIKLEGEEKAFLVYWDNKSKGYTSNDLVKMFEKIFKTDKNKFNWGGIDMTQLTDLQSDKKYLLGILRIILTNLDY